MPAVRSFAEGDEVSSPNKDSPGRLLALSDGVFAIAMTLLALDLHVPDLGRNPTDGALTHALREQVPNYLAFLISFYVVAAYWTRHRRLMRSVKTTDARLVRLTLLLLLCVAALPFPAGLLGKYASHPISLVFYGGLNAVAVSTLLLLHHTVRTHHLADGEDDEYSATFRHEVTELLGTLVVFLLLIPAGFLWHDNGPWVLVLILAIQRPFSKRLIRARNQRYQPEHERNANAG
jgi:uncharacterized membrane protein